MEPPCFTSLTKPWPCLPLLPVPTCTRHSAWARQMQGHRHRDLPGFLACRTQHSRRAGAAQDTLAQAFESIVSRRSSGRGSCTWSLRWGRWWSCSCQSHNPAPNLAWLTKCLRNSGGVQGRNGVLCTAGWPGCPCLFGISAAKQLFAINDLVRTMVLYRSVGYCVHMKLNAKLGWFTKQHAWPNPVSG